MPVEELGPIAQTIRLDCVICEDATGSELMKRIEALNGVKLLEDMREGFVAEI